MNQELSALFSKRWFSTVGLIHAVALLLVSHVLSNTTIPPGCEFEGKFYRPGEEITRGQVGDWCYGTSCSPTAEIVRWDDFNCGTVETTVPTQGRCEHEGRWYNPGETISQGKSGSWCYGSYCDLNGDVINWDNFNCGTTPDTSGPPSTTPRITQTTTLPRPRVNETETPTQPPSTTETLTPSTLPPPNVCVYEGQTYSPGDVIWRDTRGCGYECGENGQLLAYPCLPPTTTQPPTTPTTTTTSVPPTTPHGCFYNGRFYPPGQVIDTGPSGCGGFCSSDGNIVLATCTTATTPTTTTTSAPRTTLRGCFYNGRIYPPGQDIDTGPSGCGGFCSSDGNIVLATCTTPTSTTTTTTSVPRTTLRGCFYNGRIYPPGQDIDTGPSGCGGFCSSDGNIVLATCTTRTSTTTTTTSVPRTTLRGCFYNGRIYPPGQNIDTGPSGCGGFCSSDGNIVLATCTTPTSTTTYPTTTYPVGCIYNGKFYPPNRAIERDAFGCGAFCSSTGQLILATCIPTTRRVTTPPLACFYNGKYYPPNQVIEPDAFGCGAFCSESGEVFAATCGPNPITTTSTTSSTAPTATSPPGCLYKGKLYRVGEKYAEGKQGSWCYGKICTESGPLEWDNFQCDPTTSPTTTPPEPTSSPTTSPPGCLYKGKLYRVGEKYAEGKQGSWCYGKICTESGPAEWDNFQCDPTTSPTNTPSEPTSSPTRSSRRPTTTSQNSQSGCLYNGKRYQVGEEISRTKSLNMCYGTLCDANGDVIAWEDFTCGNSSEVGPTREPARDCTYQGETYRPGQRILLADSRGCKVYCSLAGRVRIERFPCFSPVTNPSRLSTVSVVKRTPEPCIRPENADPNAPLSNICLSGSPRRVSSSLILYGLVCFCALLFITS